jgi:hypothetical protein
MQEEFLWHIWKFKLFNRLDLKTTQGEKIHIIKTGEHNSDAGPDFTNARIKIGSIEWVGNVEVHLKSSHWNKHYHSENAAYDTIILHVVNENDQPIVRKNGEAIPTLELKETFRQELFDKYQSLQSGSDWIPCKKQITTVNQFILNSWLDRLLIERLERKANEIGILLKQNKNNWEEVFYQTLARYFGQKINSLPFELVAKALPYSYLAKHKNSLHQIEAMLFGVAGMLEGAPKTPPTPDPYFLALQKEFFFLAKKFKLTPIRSHLWKFLRLHPQNFPTIRISQFANLIYHTSHLFSTILENTSAKQLSLLLATKASDYWNTHYQFGNTSPSKKKTVGNDFIATLIINVIVPFLFVYGKEKGNEEYISHALSLLEELKPEKNSILSKWNSIGVPAKNAGESQALLQLKNEYCHKKKCLKCAVGVALLSS